MFDADWSNMISPPIGRILSEVLSADTFLHSYSLSNYFVLTVNKVTHITFDSCWIILFFHS